MHLDAMRFAGADIVAVWDDDPHQAAAFVGFEQAVAAADLVVLMGHPARLPAQARAVIEARKPLILEKPAVTATPELEHLCALAAAVGAVVGVPLPNRFGPAMLEFRRLRAGGQSGPVVHAGFRLINGPPQRYRDDGVPWLLAPAIGGGGALRNLGIHGIDAALSLAEGELRLLASHIGKRIHTDERVEDHALVTLADDGGALFVVEAGYTYASMAPGGDFEWRSPTGPCCSTRATAPPPSCWARSAGLSLRSRPPPATGSLPPIRWPAWRPAARRRSPSTTIWRACD
mgnify:CR=1 FL=1